MNRPEERYEIIGTLGTGATSRVDKARDRVIGRTVALKTFLHAFGSGDFQQRFLQEAQIVGQLTHPFIVGLHDVGTNRDRFPYLVMEYVDGKTLEKTLDAGPLPLERAALWGADLAAALDCAHQCKIIHGDLKPANVLITREGQVKLGDFGIARFATQVSASGKLLGTPAYLSPEQILGNKQDTRSDLFSLGIILYEMTTGVRPFDGTSVGAVCAQIITTEPVPPSQHNPSLPPAFDHVVMRCLAKDPAKRYADAATLRVELQPFVHRNVDLPLQGSWWHRPLQRGDMRLLAGVLLLLAIFGAATGAARRSSASVKMPATPASVSSDVVGPRTSPSAAPSAEPALSMITVSPVDVGSSNVDSGSSANTVADAVPSSASQSARHFASGSGLDSSQATGSPSATLTQQAPPLTHRGTRRTIAPAKSVNLATTASAAGSVFPALPTSVAPSSLLALTPAVESPTTPAPAPKAVLHLEIAAAASSEVLSIFDGAALLLCTTLQNVPAGGTLHFDYPVATGHHDFRVLVARPGEQASAEKRSATEIRADGSNLLVIHVSRRSKLLLLHETALEVVWRGTDAPLTAKATPLPPGASAMR
jgi:serine/threonine protein kinase